MPEVSAMQKSKATLTIENVVASATLNQKVDLNAVVKGYPGVEYRPEQFPGLVFRLKRPKTATLIFNSGKMVCTGAKSEKRSQTRRYESRQGTQKRRHNHHW
jgi:transcription initiation factor TFIID TATA-box-binding protein